MQPIASPICGNLTRNFSSGWIYPLVNSYFPLTQPKHQIIGQYFLPPPHFSRLSIGLPMPMKTMLFIVHHFFISKLMQFPRKIQYLINNFPGSDSDSQPNWPVAQNLHFTAAWLTETQNCISIFMHHQTDSIKFPSSSRNRTLIVSFYLFFLYHLDLTQRYFCNRYSRISWANWLSPPNFQSIFWKQHDLSVCF